MIFYGITCFLSLIIFISYFFIIKKKSLLFILLFLSIFICNLGYFLLSISKHLTVAIIANDIAYLGSVFLPFFMMLIILDVCKIKYPKYIIIILLAIASVVLFIVTSVGYLPIYYKDQTLIIGESGSYLEKVYGPLHIVYYFYIGLYLLFMIGIIIINVSTKKDKLNLIIAIILLLIVVSNIFVWLIEQFIDNEFEFLSVTYLIDEILLVLLKILLINFEKVKEEINQSSKVDMSLLDGDRFNDEQIANAFKKCDGINLLTNREKEILKHILKGERRKEIAFNLFVSESAIKKHTSNIFKKLNVNNRKELLVRLSKI